MSIFRDIEYSKSPNIDAFGRLRVSQVTTQFDAKQLHDNLPLFIDIEEIGTGNSTHVARNAENQLTTSASSDAVILQTKQRFNYQSGKSQLLFWTFNNFGVQTNITKRVGYFSSSTTTPFTSTLDGFFLESDGTDLRVKVYREGTEVDNVVQSSWDDPLDGTGASGITHDFDNNTIMVCSFEWLGVGEIQFGIVKDGVIIPFLYLDHTEEEGVYMSSPNQPLRWELRQTGTGSGSLNVICSSVNSEGSLNSIGKDGGIDDDGTHLNANLTTEWYMAVGLRLKTTHLDTVVDIISGYLMSTTNDKFLYRIELNPTLNGTVTWNAVTDYGVEYALGVQANRVTTHGTILNVGGGAENTDTPFDLDTAIKLGSKLDGTVDEIFIVVKPLTANLDIHRGINWKEPS